MKRAPEGERWRLQAITIRHFRGVADERTVRFDGLPGLLHGHNGVGKSTVAQCLQWTLYGRFPQNVLPNVSMARFLAPVEGKKKAYCGEVTFQRGAERLLLRRDEADGKFTLVHGARRLRDEEAEAKRDELLGLDMDTFVRAVLLQQSRIRGLLLDEPRERNMALDRLLGMDALERLTNVVQSKKFSDAAQAWRQQIVADEVRFEAKEGLLRQQRETAENAAREHGFKNKDFSRVGLEKAYMAVGERLAAAATKYDVEIDPLPACDALSKAAATHRRVMAALGAIRLESNLKKRLAPVDARLDKLERVGRDWVEAMDAREKVKALIADWVERNGDKDAVVAERKQTRKDIASQKREVETADALYSLLESAHAYAEHREIESCPVCEQALPRGMKLTPALEKRMKKLASKTLDDLRAALDEGRQKLEYLKDELEQFEELENDLKKAQLRVERTRREAATVLESEEVAEAKVEKRIADTSAKLGTERDKILGDLNTMTEELAAIQDQSQAIQDGLVPLLRKRDEQETNEKEWEARKNAHANDAARAERMDRLALQLDRIRGALLRAKEDLASESLNRAGPRAAELYRKLVRHPCFDTLRLATQQKARKVDYAFEVSSGGSSKTALEARLALSDGQLTATALGVFFALAESTAHGLDLLYVDDPTQNLDLPCKEAMAKVIVEIARRKQVIVSTHDEDFVALLETEGFNERGVVHHVADWKGNPTYRTTGLPTSAP
ncbi:AAA family ATPase [Polyangium aurulentum]|uniref:AAA family ATPase n=1 Tax=Polyangium aurulentum TaxID=2567896 RepID=UPI0010AE26A1|nr:AAA family ATPase [Polyangium aurulentum]UQA61391.1 AAA family ATPase [Polyangium aurulentum]